MNKNAVRERQLENRCDTVGYRAGRLHEWLKPLLRASAAVKNAYAFKPRLKTSGDIMAKVQAKRNHPDPKLRKSSYQPSKVTDASGFRIVCLFNADIPIALGHIFDLIAAPVNADPQGKFGPRPVREVIYYSSRDDNEPLSIFSRVSGVVNSKGYRKFFKRPRSKGGGDASSYSSVHLIVEVLITEAGKKTPFSAFSEIQVRSVFEEAWGEINHRLNYAPAKRARARGISMMAASDGDSSLLHLDALKSLTDGCAQYADLINAQLLERGDGAKRNPQSVELPKQLLKPFQQCDEPVRRKIEAAYAVEEDAEKRPYDDAEKPEKFYAAGMMFSDAADSLKASAVPADPATHERLVRLLNEEIGYCYMFSGNSELVSKAEDIFQDVLSADPDNAIVLVRLAQLKRDAEAFEPARELMERARRVMAASGVAGKDRLAWLVGRDLAFLCWKLVDVEPSRPDAVGLLERAVELSEAAIAAAPTDGHGLNAAVNLLYYYVDLVERLEGKERAAVADQAKRQLAEIAPKVDLDKWRETYLDSVLRAERTFGDPQRARVLAAVLVKRLREKLAAERSDRQRSRLEAFNRLTPDERDMLLYAEEALAGHEAPPAGGSSSGA